MNAATTEHPAGHAVKDSTPAPPAGACICWDGPCVLHEGHCCIADAPEDVVTFEGLPCGHGPEARARDAASKEHQ